MLQLRRSRRRDAPPAQIVTTARVAAARRRAALLRLVKASPFPPTLYCCSSGFVLQQCCSLQAHLPALATRLLRSYSLAAQVQPSSQENEMRRLKINQYFLLTKLNCKPYHLSLFFWDSVLQRRKCLSLQPRSVSARLIHFLKSLILTARQTWIDLISV